MAIWRRRWPLLRRGLEAYRATGAEQWMPHYTALLASGFEIASEVAEAVNFLGDALQIVEKTGECWYAAALNRHSGRLLLRQEATPGRRGSVQRNAEHRSG